MKYYSAGFVVYCVLLAALVGLVLGSFCNAWAWRIVHHERIDRGRSHCPGCGHTLGAKDLVPLFSWLFLHGKCRYCGAKISRRYPLTEALMCLYVVSMLLCRGISLPFLRFLLLGVFLLPAALADYDTMELPDGLTLAAACTALLRLAEPDGWKSMLWGLVVPAVLLLLVIVMDKLLGKESMGGGDIKLTAALALHFGAGQTVLLLILACIIGLAAAAIGKKGSGKPFPFGPSLCLAAWLTALIGPPLLTWYTAFL